MAIRDPIVLFIGDASVLSSLQFSLEIESFETRVGSAGGPGPFPASALVIDQGLLGHGLAALEDLRAGGWSAPAIVLATNPTSRMRARAAAAQVVLIEKPLQGGELGAAIHAALTPRKAA